MYIPEGYYFQVSDRILKIFWLSTKKNVTSSPLPRALKILTPTREERSTWGGKKSLRVFTHPSGSQRQDSCSILKFEPQESKVEGRKWFLDRFIPS